MNVRELSGHAQMRALSYLWARIWEAADEQIVPKEVLVGAELSGHQIHGAFDGDQMVGGSWGFLAWDGERASVHSHITGVLPAFRGSGAGLALKLAQKSWCLAREIRTVTWTFDPMIGRNAAFNLRKLGATGVRFLPDFYGPMNDRFNAGEPTDRVEIAWDLNTPPPKEPPAGGIATGPIPKERSELRRRLSELFDDGYVASWFDAERGYVFVKDV